MYYTNEFLKKKRPETFMDYNPGEIPKKNSTTVGAIYESPAKTTTVTTTKKRDPFLEGFYSTEDKPEPINQPYRPSTQGQPKATQLPYIPTKDGGAKVTLYGSKQTANPYDSNFKIIGNNVTEKDYEDFITALQNERTGNKLDWLASQMKSQSDTRAYWWEGQPWMLAVTKRETKPVVEGFNKDLNSESKWKSDLFKEKNDLLKSRFLPDANHMFHSSQIESVIKPPAQSLKFTPTITNAINRNLNAKNECKPIGIYATNKEPVITQLSNKSSLDYDRSNKDVWSFKHDAQGVDILSHWLFGGGEDFIQEDGVWGNYMKSNEELTSKVKNIVLPLADDLDLNDSKEVDITIPMEIENGESIAGYQYLHGTNSDAGGFQIQGKIYKNEKGDVTYDLTYTWNDIIDPNLYYSTDAMKAEFAKSIPFADPKDYTIRISWHDKTQIKAKPRWFDQNYGWLK